MILFQETQSKNILLDTENIQLEINIQIDNEFVNIRNDTYPNLQTLSADLRSALGFNDAVDFLMENEVDKNSKLWDLNHDNPWK